MLNQIWNEASGKVFEKARAWAVAFRHGKIGTEHVLLALMELHRDLVPSLPEHITNQSMQEVVAQAFHAERDVPEKLQFSSDLQVLCEKAIRYVRSQEMPQVSPAVLWLMILDERNVALKILALYGANIAKMTEDIKRALIQAGFSGAVPDGRHSETVRVGAPGEREHADLEDENKQALRFAVDLTRADMVRRFDAVVGRDEEIERMLHILSRRTKNNPVLIGEPGVGKSAVVEGLAKRIFDGRVPEQLKRIHILRVDLPALVAGTKYRGDFEDRMMKLIDAVKQRDDIVLFFDEIQSIVGAGDKEGPMDAASILKPVLARGEIKCIGTTTIRDYRKYIENDTALSRRFQQIMVKEPTVQQSIKILEGLKLQYERHHHVTWTDEAMHAAVALTERYVHDRFLPDKAIDLMDEVSAEIHLKHSNKPQTLTDAEEALAQIRKGKLEAVKNQDYERAAALRDEEKEKSEALEQARAAWHEQLEDACHPVTKEDVAKTLSGWTGIPIQRMTREDSELLLHLEDKLHSRVVGQQEAVSAVARAIKRRRSGLSDTKRPMGTFLFLGPTGVGKTELCKALSQTLFASEDEMIRLDMSEYMDKHSVSRLIGSPPGYVGYEERGQLTEAIYRKPYSVVLFDEIEKAHPDVFHILLQIMEDGRLTDNQGKVVSFQNAIIVLTSNVGAGRLIEERTLGFAKSGLPMMDYSQMHDKAMEEVKKAFKPEFINRLDEIIVFHALKREHLVEIARLMMERLAARLKEQEIDLSYDDAVLGHLAQKGSDLVYGARPLRRTIQHLIEDALSEKLIAGEVQRGEHIHAVLRDGEIDFTK